MNYLIIGNGGRENSILKKLAENTNNNYYYTGEYNNFMMDKYGEFIKNSTHNSMIYLMCKHYNIDIVVIGSESYLEKGLVDLLKESNIKCIGPSKKLAMLETSKSFARNLMVEAGLNNYCPEYKIFDIDSNTIDYIDYMNKLKTYVIKADGLHSGKGVKVFGEHLHNIEESFFYCKQILDNGEKFIIEEKLIGEEFSLMSFTDGETFVHMPPIQDYKRAYNNNTGPNTGSMGSVSYENHMLPFLDNNEIDTCKLLNEKVVNYLQKKVDDIYCGIVYGSFMKTDNGIKIIEYNVRFGDPECINIMSILDSDLSVIFEKMVDRKLDNIVVNFDKKATCCRYVVPNGYPENPIKNHEIYIDDKIDLNNLICANMKLKIKNDSKYYYELGSRTAAIIGKGYNMNGAIKIVENEIKYITGPVFYRTDIGKINFNYLNNDNSNNDSSNNNDNNDKYKKAGVDIDEGNKVIKKIRNHVESTFNYNVLSKFGDFAGLYNLGNNVLVTSIDGVGTKSILVLEKYGPIKGYEMLGQDLVNHSVNDILVKGAKPLFFLDYYASSKIKSEYVEYFVKGLSKACKEVGCVLIGGETAEMPGIYKDNECDIVGAIVGMVDKNKIINGKQQIEEGDLIIGLPSSGPHTNGYSLIRKLVNEDTSDNIIDKLCATHKCYYKDIMELIENSYEIHGMCHITGGGWGDNSERVIPDNLMMEIDDIEMTECFKYLKNVGNISKEEMYRTFNCGIGMLVYVKDNGKKLDNVIGRIKKK